MGHRTTTSMMLGAALMAGACMAGPAAEPEEPPASRTGLVLAECWIVSGGAEHELRCRLTDGDHVSAERAFLEGTTASGPLLPHTLSPGHDETVATLAPDAYPASVTIALQLDHDFEDAPVGMPALLDWTLQIDAPDRATADAPARALWPVDVWAIRLEPDMTEHVSFETRLGGQPIPDLADENASARFRELTVSSRVGPVELGIVVPAGTAELSLEGRLRTTDGTGQDVDFALDGSGTFRIGDDGVARGSANEMPSEPPTDPSDPTDPTDPEESTGCATVFDCGLGEDCDLGTGTCVSVGECALDLDCTDGMVCDEAHMCVRADETPDDTPCATDFDCGVGEVCGAGSCTSVGECAIDADCALDAYCDAGTCVTGTRPEPPACDAAYDDTLAFATTVSFIDPGRICAADEDWWYVDSTGPRTVEVSFVHADGDIDIEVFDAFGTSLGSSTSTTNRETYTASAPFYVRVYGYGGAVENDYSITFY